MKTFWLAAAAAGVLATVAQAAPAPGAGAAAHDALTTAPRFGAFGLDLAAEDRSVRPNDDLFQFANGDYLKTHQIPADRSRYGAFDQLIELSQNRMRAVLEAAAADRAASGERAKVAAFYRSFMDEGRLEQLGAQPLAGDLAAVRQATTRPALARLMGQAHRGFGASFFEADVEVDEKDPAHYGAYLGQGGLGLPDRDYYLKPEFAAQKTAYEAYVAELLRLGGWSDPQAAARDIVALETRIAEVSWSRAERRDRDRTYNLVETSQLASFAPGFDWAGFLQGADIGQAQRLIVQENTAIPKIAALFAETPVPTLQAWAAFHVIDQAAPYLSSPFVQAHFAFRQKTLSGQPALAPRWKRGVGAVDTYMGQPLGKLYVADYFPAASKAQMEALVGDIRTALHGRIERLEWMSPATKQKALDKLAKLTVKIGYPDKWRDYSGLEVRDGDLYGDVTRAVAFEWEYHARRLGKPTDRTEWELTPPTVNAYYNATLNEIVFPAAILQPPFFDPKADAAVNYGGIGGVIGHEITHGFDDQGRKSDGDGRLTDWWTPEDAARFKAEAAKYGGQYAAFEVLPGAHINPDLTMGENIADLGGLHLALDAYHASLHGRPAPVVGGLTGDQRVFLAWGQVWRGMIRDDRVRQMLVTDPHSPNRARVDVPARNVDAFYAAFGVKPGDGMYVAPADRARIW